MMNSTLGSNTLYNLINYLPYVLIMVTAFNFKLRYSESKTIFAIVLTTILQLMIGYFLKKYGRIYISSTTLLEIISAILMLCDIFICLWLINDVMGRVIFAAFIMANLSSVLAIVAKTFEGLIFGDYPGTSWVYCAILIVVNLLTLPPAYFYCKDHLVTGYEDRLSEDDWKWLWLIPMSFYVIWYYLLYHNAYKTSSEIAGEPIFGCFSIFFLIAQLFIFGHVTNRVKEHIIAMDKEIELKYMKIGQAAADDLEKHMQEVRILKHDMRHHISMMAVYAQEGEIEKLTQYIMKFKHQMEEMPQIMYCANKTLNTLMVYVMHKMQKENVKTEISLQVPEEIGFNDIEITNVFGNLLENAYHACQSQVEGERIFKFKMEKSGNRIICIMDNTFSNEIKKDKDGNFISTKENGSGMGTKSVKKIVERHGGIYETSIEGNYFRTSIMYRI